VASKRHVRRKSCEGKFKHPSATSAYLHARALNRDRGKNDVMSVYKCAFCSAYHTGHASRRRGR